MPRQKPGWLTGALIGALFTATLIALLYLADQAFGLPFPPFDVFDWIARVLPGQVITRGIDTMVEFIDRFDLGETSSTAKTLETLMALLTFFGGGVVTGAVLFAALNAANPDLRGAARYLPGLAAGAVLGLPAILISQDVNVTATTSDSVSVLWLALAFLVWGAALSWAYYRLRRIMSGVSEHELAVVRPVPASSPTAAAGEAAHREVHVEPISRREFLIRVGGATATLTVFGAGLGRYLEYREEQQYQERIEANLAATTPEGLPNAGAAVQPVPGTRPEYTPLEDHYRIDINLRPPEIDGDAWALSIGGMVDNPRALTIDQIMNDYPAQDQYVTLACISNRIAGDLTSTTRWTGAPLRDVLADAGVQDGATHILIHSEDGFFETVALDLIDSDERIMLAYHWDGIPLLHQHGFPLRVYIPDRYGMKQPKWITEIEVIDHDEDGYWVERGWDKVAQMRATSVVDVVGETIERDGQMFVPVGGIAHAGARGISKVEVQVDDGEWQAAELRDPLSETTWVIWRYEWPFEEGEHRFAVRCYDGSGELQITEDNPTKPSGATGIHSLTREL